MSSKRAIRRRQCDGKKRHATAADAMLARATLNRSKGYQGRMNVYRCQFCRGYHIGHAPERLSTDYLVGDVTYFPI